ncbi:MAG: hypothetical protein KAJ54_03545, partial [Candidatus Aenigmarchaeota archaeon]|nr:hypothetical protein [Candidatus Aenigmarchaeota archaeon]
MKDNVEKLRRAIGIDFDHSHGPAEEINLNQPPLPNNYQSQQQNQKEPEQPQVPKPFAIDGQKPPISIQREPIKIEPKSSQPHQTPIQGDNTLFVKIDKHQDVAVEISRTKIEMKNMVDTISILNQAEKLKAEA